MTTARLYWTQGKSIMDSHFLHPTSGAKLINVTREPFMFVNTRDVRLKVTPMCVKQYIFIMVVIKYGAYGTCNDVSSSILTFTPTNPCMYIYMMFCKLCLFSTVHVRCHLEAVRKA